MMPPSDPNAYAPVAPVAQPLNRDQLLMEYLMQQGAAQPAQQKIAQQRALAQQLRQGGAAPGMRSSRSSVGGTMDTAAHPLEMLGSLANTAAGTYTGMQADAGQEAAQALQGKQLAELRDRMYPKQPVEPQPMGSGF